MPVIKGRTHRVRMVRHICRLQEPNRDTLVAYARFIGDSVDYVVNQLIEGTLGKDRDFAIWRAAQRLPEPLDPVRSDPAGKPSAGGIGQDEPS